MSAKWGYLIPGLTIVAVVVGALGWAVCENVRARGKGRERRRWE